MSTGPSLYYDGHGSYGFPWNFLSIKPLKGVEKNYISRKFVNVENLHRSKSWLILSDADIFRVTFFWQPFFRGPIFLGSIFRGPIFRGPIFRGPIFWGSIFRGPIFRGPFFPGIISPGTIFLGDHFSVDHFSRGSSFEDHFSGGHFSGDYFSGIPFKWMVISVRWSSQTLIILSRSTVAQPYNRLSNSHIGLDFQSW